MNSDSLLRAQFRLIFLFNLFVLCVALVCASVTWTARHYNRFTPIIIVSFDRVQLPLIKTLAVLLCAIYTHFLPLFNPSVFLQTYR